MPTDPSLSSGNACLSFDDFALDARLLDATRSLGFDKPTPIQAQSIPHLLAGKSVIGRARTGSGKTAAFGLPLMNLLKEGSRSVQALILAPTRELALQVKNSLASYAENLPVDVVAIYGGTPYGPQLQALRRGVSVVVGTPGRVIDHLERGSLDLSQVKLLVLDEADEMLRMGFVDAVTRIFDATPDNRQVALFSATMPQPIKKIAQRYMSAPLEVQVEEQALSTAHIEQFYVLLSQSHKADALLRILGAQDWETAIIFAKTKVACAEVMDLLRTHGFAVEALHGDLNQDAREGVLKRIRAKRSNVLVATDVAARGLDVDHITHVINLSLPMDQETYVHRIGRTGRAGRKGTAVTFVTAAERRKLHSLRKALSLELKHFPLPSDAQVAEYKADKVHQRIMASVENASSSSTMLRDRSQRLLAECSPDVLVGACLRILGKQTGLDFDRDHSADPPAWSQEQDGLGEGNRVSRRGGAVHRRSPKAKKAGHARKGSGPAWKTKTRAKPSDANPKAKPIRFKKTAKKKVQTTHKSKTSRVVRKRIVTPKKG